MKTLADVVKQINQSRPLPDKIRLSFLDWVHVGMEVADHPSTKERGYIAEADIGEKNYLVRGIPVCVAEDDPP